MLFFFRTQITESVICELTKISSEDRMIRLNLKEILNERKMTQADLSAITGIRPSTICDMYNNNSTFLKLEYIEKICRELDCSIESFMQFD